MLLNTLSLVVVLGVVVFLHEGGHFLMARGAGARVSVFSLGFGRRLFGLERGGTDYRVSAIPLGGYVRIHGLGPDESDITGGEGASDPLLPRLKRAVILLAGPLANAASAVILLALAFMVGTMVPVWQDQPPEIAWVDPSSPAASAGLQTGDLVLAVDGKAVRTWRDLELATRTSAGHALSVRFRRAGEEREVQLTPRSVTRFDLGYAGLAPPIPAEVGSVVPGSPAERSGLRQGDRVLAVNGEPVRNFLDLMRLVGASPGRKVSLTVARAGGTLTIEATPQEVDGQGKLGITQPSPGVLKRLGPVNALLESVRECVRITRETFAVISRMLRGRASIKQMSGPIDIARFSGEAARTGIVPFIWLLGVISLQLAIFNLLPVPVLDGGHLAIIALEGTLRRDFSDRTKERILTVGFWLLVALMIVVLFNDVTKNVAWERFFPSLTR
jgi:regulator of sigma E protease